MVVTVDELEEKGLAERKPSSTDRRARVISVTKAGERTVAQGQKIIDRIQGDVLENLPAKERKVFLEALGSLVKDRLSQPADGLAAAAAARAPALAHAHSERLSPVDTVRRTSSRRVTSRTLGSSQDDLVRDYLLRSPYQLRKRPEGDPHDRDRSQSTREKTRSRCRATARAGSRWSSSASGC